MLHISTEMPTDAIDEGDLSAENYYLSSIEFTVEHLWIRVYVLSALKMSPKRLITSKNSAKSPTRTWGNQFQTINILNNYLKFLKLYTALVSWR